MTSNPYEAPQAQLDSRPTGDAGSLEAAMRGDYHVDPFEILMEARSLLRGFKVTAWGALIILAVTALTAQLAVYRLGFDGSLYLKRGEFLAGAGVSIAGGLLLLPITMPLFAGVYGIAIRRASGGSPNALDIGRYFKAAPNLVLLGLFNTALTYLSFAAFIVPGVFVIIAGRFALPLLIDHDLSPWDAIVTSLKSARHQWFAIASTVFMFGFIIVLSAIPLGIGLIWSVPLYVAGLGVLYRTIFGVRRPAEPVDPPR